MEINLEKLKKNFLTIKDIRSKVSNVFNILEGYLLNMKKMYLEFIETNRQNLFVFGLDSFQFQSKLIDIEYDDMKRLFLAINNRMYCEYYKLYKIVSEYVIENISDKKTLDLIKVTNNFPVYKDLEPFKQYNFEMTQQIHENIILLLYGMNEYIINKENELQIHKKNQEIGLNINNFVTTFNYSINMIKEKVMLFISYIEFFHNLHTKYLQRFSMKMNLMYSQVTHDIKFENTPKNVSKNKKELINDYETNNIDKNLITEIRRSFDDSDSNNSDTPNKIEIKGDIKTNNSLISPIVENTQSEIQEFNDDLENKNTKGETKKISSLFKNSVKKVMSGMRIFNKKKSTEDSPIEQILNDCNLNEISNSQSPFLKDVPETEHFKNDLKIEIYDYDNDINVYNQKLKEDIFIEISEQCLAITDSTHSIDNQKSLYSFIDNNEDAILIPDKIDEDLSVITMESNNYEQEKVERSAVEKREENVEESEAEKVEEQIK